MISHLQEVNSQSLLLHLDCANNVKVELFVDGLANLETNPASQIQLAQLIRI